MSTPAAITEEQVRAQLRQVRYPGFSRDIVSFGIVKAVEIAPNSRDVTVYISIATNQPAIPQQIQREAGDALRTLPGIGGVDLRFDIQNPIASQTGTGPNQIDGVRHVLAVASGKGGVGKSTVAANLAVALRGAGASVGEWGWALDGPGLGGV